MQQMTNVEIVDSNFKSVPLTDLVYSFYPKCRILTY